MYDDALDRFHDELKARRPIRTISLAAALVIPAIAAEELNGFGRLFPLLDMATWELIAALCGAAALAIFYPKHWSVGLVPGSMMGVMNFLAAYYYTRHRISYHSAEIVFIGALAAIPAMLLYYLLLRRIVVVQR